MSHRASLPTALAVGSLALAACFASPPSQRGAVSPGPGGECPAVAPSSSHVTGTELRKTHVPDLLEAVRRLRPRFLRSHAPRRDQSAVVYVDGTRAGDVLTLRDIPVIDVLEVQFLRPSDATTRFGTDHTGGALLVRTQAAFAQRWCPGG